MINLDNIEELEAAIIRQARWDYIHAKEEEDPHQPRQWTKEEVREFINSRWFELLTQGAVDPEYLMEEFERARAAFRREVAEKKAGTYAPRVVTTPRRRRGRPRKDATK